MYVDYTYLYLLELSIYLFSSLAFLFFFFLKKHSTIYEFIHKMQLENNCLKYNNRSREGKPHQLLESESYG